MRDIAIYGAGGFGKEVACLLNRINEVNHQWNLIGFFDDIKKKGDIISHYGIVLGSGDDINYYPTDLDIVIAIGSPEAIKEKVALITNEKLNFPKIIDPSFKVIDKETFVIGRGNIIQGACTVSCNVHIGDFNVMNGSVVIGHDVNIGNFNIFMPAIRISGAVIIDNDNFFGVGSIVLQQVKVKNKIRLGAGSVLMFSPKRSGSYIGNPAKMFDY